MTNDMLLTKFFYKPKQCGYGSDLINDVTISCLLASVQLASINDSSIN